MSTETVVDERDGRKRRKVIFADVEQEQDDQDSNDSDEEEEESGSDVSEDESDVESDEQNMETSDVDEAQSMSKSEFQVPENEQDEDSTALNWKANLAQKAADSFVSRQNTTANLWKLVYGSNFSTRLLQNNALKIFQNKSLMFNDFE